MGARSKLPPQFVNASGQNSRVPRWGHDQNNVVELGVGAVEIAECPDGGTIKTR